MMEQRAMLRSEPELDALVEPSPEPVVVTPGQPLVTVCGAALEQGERVLFFARARHVRSRVIYALLGVLLTPLLVGIAFLVYGILYERWNLRFVAVTSRRVIVQRGARPARWLRLADVTDVRAKRGKAAGVAAAPAPAAALPSESAPAEKTDIKHWVGANAIIVQGPKGALSIDQSIRPELLGPAVANAVWTEGYVDRVPAVVHPS
jgi:hypothetical protein